MEANGRLHAPAALPPGKSPRYPLDRRLGGHQSQPRRYGVEKNVSPLPGIEPGFLGRPARSPSLCGLRYPGSCRRNMEYTLFWICWRKCLPPFSDWKYCRRVDAGPDYAVYVWLWLAVVSHGEPCSGSVAQGLLRCFLAVQKLRRLVAGFPPRWSGFEPRSRHVRFVVDKDALGKIFSEYLGFPRPFSFHRLLHTHHLSSGLVQEAKQWPTYQVDSVSPHAKKQKKRCFFLLLLLI
jgi:hypothetical protein